MTTAQLLLTPSPTTVTEMRRSLRADAQLAEVLWAEANRLHDEGEIGEARRLFAEVERIRSRGAELWARIGPDTCPHCGN